MDSKPGITTNLLLQLNEIFNVYGFECHAFKVEWYNNHVKPIFQLNYDSRTLGFVIISTPSFFEKGFVPFVTNNLSDGGKCDLLDQCITELFKSTLHKHFSGQEIDIIHDFEMRPGTRRPKVLVQTAGHVSGAVYFYQKNDVTNPPWNPDQNIYGVCLHPKYSGWFALRGVFIFKNVLVPDLEYTPPVDVLKDDDNKKVELLNLYNKHWSDWRFRRVTYSDEEYSELQQKYFSTPPSERKVLIESIRNNVTSVTFQASVKT